jgi:hypothetical protein
MGMAARRMVTWEAIHENGWTTTVTQRPDGTFVAVTEDCAGLRLSEVAVSLDHARDAVRRALTGGGHAECSLECSEWAMTTTAARLCSLDSSADDSEAPAEPSVLSSSGRERRAPRHWSH